MSGEAEVQRFDADFKKVAGTLTLTSTTIAWVPKSINAMDRQQQTMSRAVSMSSHLHSHFIDSHFLVLNLTLMDSRYAS